MQLHNVIIMHCVSVIQNIDAYSLEMHSKRKGKNVKLTVCLFLPEHYTMTAYGGSEGIAPLVL
jgi:hypothetical protein